VLPEPHTASQQFCCTDKYKRISVIIVTVRRIKMVCHFWNTQLSMSNSDFLSRSCKRTHHNRRNILLHESIVILIMPPTHSYTAPISEKNHSVDMHRKRLHLQNIWSSSHLLTLVPRSRIFISWRWRRLVPPKRRFTQHLHGATSQKTAFLIVTAVKTSNLISEIAFTCPSQNCVNAQLRIMFKAGYFTVEKIK
jgi:hypothetical protein